MIYPFDGKTPVVPLSAYLSPSVDLIGDVTLGDESSIWFGSVVRGDMNHIRIGRRTNIQDNCTVHVTIDIYPTLIGDEVTIGHNAIIHGCVIGDRCMIGMGAVIMDGAEIGEGSLIAAGAVIPPGTIVLPKSLYAGVPGKYRREVSGSEYDEIVGRAQLYVDFALRYKAAGQELTP